MELTAAEEKLMILLSAALRSEQVPPDLLTAEEWAALLPLCTAHKLLAPVFQAAYDCSAVKEAENYSAVRRTVRLQVVGQAAKDAAFSELYAGLLSEGLTPLVVKGVLCRSTYPEGDLRISADEDLYISTEQFPTCCELLIQYGMVPLSDTEGRFEVGFRNRDGLYIELHNALFSPDSPAVSGFQKWFGRAFDAPVTYQTSAGTVYSLSESSHLLYLLLHAYKHFVRSGFGLRQVCDIGLWAKKYGAKVDWPVLASALSESCALSFAAAVFRIAGLLGIAHGAPDCILSAHNDCMPMLKDLLCAGVYGSSDKNREHSASVTLHAVSANREGKKANKLSAVFPPRSRLKKDYPVLDKHPVLLPGVWIVRLCRYGKENKKTKGSGSKAMQIAGERMELLKYYNIL